MAKLSTILKKVSTISKKEKTPVYIVGGFVRDFLLGRVEKKDIDFVVVGSGLEFAKKLDKVLKEEGRLVEFPDFDTARYLIGEGEEQIELEFAGARSESYRTDSRKPIVKEATLEQDLSRRDFTVNALAVPVDIFSTSKLPDLKKVVQHIVDPYEGQNYLQEKILKTPLEPDITFSDDPLRMIRAIRFAAQLDFSIEPKTLEAIYRNRERIKIVSMERVQEELLKLFSCPQPSVGLVLLFQTKLMDLILPEISALDGVEDVYGHSHKNNLTHTFKVVDNIAERSNNVWLRLSGFFHDIGKPATKKFMPKIGWTFYAHEFVGKKMMFEVGKRLRFPTDRIKYLAKLIRWHMQPISLMDKGITDSAVRRLIVNAGAEINDLLILGRSDITTGNPLKKEKRLKNYDWLETRVVEVIEKDKLRAFQSPLRGDEIMELCGLKPGPTVGKIKKALEEAILDGKIPNEYEATKAYFLQIKDDYLKDVTDWEKV
jgi:tRNA nucleotidyltransferase/poly(A) polymerase